MIAIVGGGRETVVGWLARPGVAIPMILLLIALFWHMALGLTVVAEDYLHNTGVKIATVAVIQFGCLALGVVGVVAVVLAITGGYPQVTHHGHAAKCRHPHKNTYGSKLFSRSLAILYE